MEFLDSQDDSDIYMYDINKIGVSRDTCRIIHSRRNVTHSSRF